MELNRRLEERSRAFQQEAMPQNAPAAQAPPPTAAPPAEGPAVVPSDSPKSDEKKQRELKEQVANLTQIQTKLGDKQAAPGSLSLKVDLPIPPGARKLVLSKPGGSPRLSVAVRPQTSMVTGLSYIWTLAWLLLAAGIVAAFGLAKSNPANRRHIPKFAAAVGLIAAILLPTPLNFAGVLLFVVSIAIALRRHIATV
jgi:hypothetical protein